jgi:hypothetical protein
LKASRMLLPSAYGSAENFNQLLKKTLTRSLEGSGAPSQMRSTNGALRSNLRALQVDFV